LFKFENLIVLGNFAPAEYHKGMRNVEAIEEAIQKLSPAERAKLLSDLPRILPELDGDAEWNRILSDPTPNVSFSKFVDDVESQLKAGTLILRETSESEFNKER
jgi:hypothetical protein